MSEAPQFEPHEERDVNVHQVAAAGCGLLVALVFILWLMGIMTAFFVGERAWINTLSPSLPLVTPQPTSQPGLPVAPGQEWQTYQATQAAHLHGYGWVNEADDVAHIPIKRAMELLLEQGLPTPAPTPTASPTAAVSPTAEVGE